MQFQRLVAQARSYGNCNGLHADQVEPSEPYSVSLGSQRALLPVEIHPFCETVAWNPYFFQA